MWRGGDGERREMDVPVVDFSVMVKDLEGYLVRLWKLFGRVWMLQTRVADFVVKGKRMCTLGLEYYR